MKIEKKKIGPGHYKKAGVHETWSTNLSAPEQHGHIHKGQFGKHDRILIMQELMNKTRKENMPAPGCYDASKAPEPKLSKFQKSIKSSSFIDIH